MMAFNIVFRCCVRVSCLMCPWEVVVEALVSWVAERMADKRGPAKSWECWLLYHVYERSCGWSVWVQGNCQRSWSGYAAAATSCSDHVSQARTIKFRPFLCASYGSPSVVEISDSCLALVELREAAEIDRSVVSCPIARFPESISWVTSSWIRCFLMPSPFGVWELFPVSVDH